MPPTQTLTYTPNFTRTKQRTQSAEIMPYESFYFGQPSVFKSGSRHFADRSNMDDCKWITVKLPDTLVGRKTTDAQIMDYVKRTIANFLANERFPGVTIDTVAQHCRGRRCISLPIKIEEVEKSPAKFLRQAAALAGWWLDHIEKGRVTLDKNMIFTAKDWISLSEPLLDVPAEWKKPAFA